MTKINYVEYQSLISYDQALVWAIIRLREANQHPDNEDLLNYVTIRPEARDFIKWTAQMDDAGQPFFTASLLFPLIKNDELRGVPIPLQIPTYTDFELPPSPIDIPTSGQGLPLPTIPPEIDTLERLAAWLCLIGYRHGELMAYINAINIRAHATQTPATKPDVFINVHGLTYSTPTSFVELYADRVTAIGGGGGGGTSNGGGGGGDATAADAFAAFDGTPQTPNNADLAEKLEDFRESQRSSLEPPQVDPGKGYERIDTLPVCKDQDPSIKAFNSPLAKLLK